VAIVHRMLIAKKKHCSAVMLECTQATPLDILPSQGVSLIPTLGSGASGRHSPDSLA